MPGKTLFEKIWERHVVVERDDGQTLLYIDRHLAHDGSFNAFRRLRAQGSPVRRPRQTFATPDHYVPTDSNDIGAVSDPRARAIIEAIDVNAADDQEFSVINVVLNMRDLQFRQAGRFQIDLLFQDQPAISIPLWIRPAN